MLAPSALIVQTIFLEADSAEVVSVEHMEKLFDLPPAQVELMLRYISPFMTSEQRKRVERKLIQVAALTQRTLPHWIRILCP